MKVGGRQCPAQNVTNIFLWCPSTFLAMYVRLDECFCDGQYSLVSVLFAILTVPSCPTIFVKVGEHVPPCLMESAPLGSRVYYSNSGLLIFDNKNINSTEYKTSIVE